MKILHIIDSGGFYGAEMVLLNLMIEQRKQGFDVTLYSIGSSDVSEKDLEKISRLNSINVEPIRTKDGINFKFVYETIKYIEQKKIDIVHSHGYKANILLGFIPKFIRKFPLVTTIHGWTDTTIFSKIFAYNFLDSVSLFFIDKIILVSKKTLLKKRMLGKVYKSTVIENGISNNSYIFHEKTDKNIIEFCKDAQIICSIGRLSIEKAHKNLIIAFEKIFRTRNNIKLLIIGDGPEKNNLTQLISDLHLIDNVYLAGYQNNARQYLKYIDIFTLPSLTEGLPITLLECMFAKKPIIASNVGGIPTLLHDNCGLLIEPADIEELIQNIDLLLDNPSTSRKLTENAFIKVHNHYSSKKMCAEYTNIYLSLLKPVA